MRIYGTGNKGEWSEIYAILKLLADGRVYGADEHLKVLEKWLYKLSAIHHKTAEGHDVRYNIHSDLGIIRVSLAQNGQATEARQADIGLTAEKLLKTIKSENRTAFSVDFLETDLRCLEYPKLKAGTSQKQDITIILDDEHLCREQAVGFSIKSQLGEPSTLFNASRHTNFSFEVDRLQELTEEEKNNLSGLKPMMLVKNLMALGCSLKFNKLLSGTLSSNMRLIDSSMEVIWASLLLNYYSGKSSSKISDLCIQTAAENPLNFSADEANYFYSYKVKQFLSAIALGMMPSKPWKGTLDATGGYLVVKEDGELACYHIYNWNAFQDYLFANTRLETPSRSRHGFGALYEDGDATMLDLNLQIRFI